MNEKQLTIVKEYEIIEPLFHKVDFIIDNCIIDCCTNYFHTFEYKGVYDIKLENKGKNEIVSLTIAERSMNLYDLNKKSKTAQENGFLFNQIHKLTIKVYSNLSNINIHYYRKFQTPMCHRHFF